MRGLLAIRRAFGRRSRRGVVGCVVGIMIATVACRPREPPPNRVTVRLLDQIEPAGRPFVGDSCAPFDERRPSLGCTRWKIGFHPRPGTASTGTFGNWQRDVVTLPVEVPRGAVLSIALALDSSIPRDGLEGVEFILTAERDGKRHELLRAIVPATATAWDDRRVPLDAVVGAATRFHFATRIIPQKGADPGRVGAVPLWGAPEILAPAGDDSPPNVILVSLDTLRADHLGVYGDTRNLTPRIDTLAKEGTIFANAFTSYPSTTYAHLSMLSGLYPRRIGPVSLVRPVRSDITMLAQHLARAGWVTGAVTEDIMLAAATGFPRGFSTYHENLDPEPPDVESRKVEKTMGTALAWLARHAADRVFLFVHTYVVHWPYSAPKEFRFQTIKDSDVERPLSQASGRDRLRWAYAAEVRYADAQIARMMDAVARLGIAGRTLVIVTSDHGEEFWEHGGWSHGHTVYDELLHVPLVVWAPGRVPAGKRIRTPTSLTDLVPTVLDLVGLSPPAGIDGESQAGRIRDSVPESPDRVVFAEAHPAGKTPYHLVAAHTSRSKWILTDATPPRLVAYDLAADPGEQTPLDDPANVDPGRSYLARYEALGADAGGGVKTEAVDPAMQERLKSLGYLQ